MKYSRFEWLVLSVGAVSVILSIASSVQTSFVAEEIAGQVLLFGVLLGAVHWGRNGGFIAALAAVSAYVLMRIPLIATEGMTGDVLAMIGMRVLTFGAVGILGGELCGRIKYFFARLENGSTIDETTRVYNERFVRELLGQYLERSLSDRRVASVAVLEIAPALISELRPSKQRSVLRGAANLVRNDVRLVDEVGRLDDGRFVLLLPNTPRAGAEVAAERVRVGLREYLGARDESVVAEVLSLPEDPAAVQALIDGLEAPAFPPMTAQASSR